MRIHHFARTALSLFAIGAPLYAPLYAPLGAQATTARPATAERVVEPGMTREQVTARLGRPVGVRTVGTRTFLFFSNGRERRAGMSDVVFLENDAVVDAIFRAPNRRYSGTSSSAASVRPAATNVTTRGMTEGMSITPRSRAGSATGFGTEGVTNVGSGDVMSGRRATDAPVRSTTLPTIASPAREQPVRSVPSDSVSRATANQARPSGVQRPDTTGLRVNSPGDPRANPPVRTAPAEPAPPRRP